MGNPTILEAGIRPDVRFGERVVLIRPVNLYGCEIGDDVLVGPFVEIQAGVTVGARTRIQSHAFLCEGVMVGEDCFVSHGVMFINDTFAIGGPARGDRRLWRTTKIGDRVSLGTGSVILPVTIGSGVVVGAGSVVTQSLLEPGIYAGNPARLIRRIEGGRT